MNQYAVKFIRSYPKAVEIPNAHFVLVSLALIGYVSLFELPTQSY